MFLWDFLSLVSPHFQFSSSPHPLSFLTPVFKKEGHFPFCQVCPFLLSYSPPPFPPLWGPSPRVYAATSVVFNAALPSHMNTIS